MNGWRAGGRLLAFLFLFLLFPRRGMHGGPAQVQRARVMSRPCKRCIRRRGRRLAIIFISFFILFFFLLISPVRLAIMMQSTSVHAHASLQSWRGLCTGCGAVLPCCRCARRRRGLAMMWRPWCGVVRCNSVRSPLSFHRRLQVSSDGFFGNSKNGTRIKREVHFRD